MEVLHTGIADPDYGYPRAPQERGGLPAAFGVEFQGRDHETMPGRWLSKGIYSSGPAGENLKRQEGESSMKTVCVTGCLGFIGSHFTRMCLKKGWRVWGIDKKTYAARDEYIEEFG